MKPRLVGALRAVLSVVLLALAAWVLRHELRAYHWHDVVAHMKGVSTIHVILAVSFAAMSYVALTGYDALALRLIQSPLPYRRIALTSFVAYALSHSLTFFGGSAARYRMLSSWGLRADDIARVIGFVALTFWLGFLFLGGVVGLGWPVSLGLPGVRISSRIVGVVSLAVVAVYLRMVWHHAGPIRLRGFELHLPGPKITAGQLLVSTVDWSMASLCLYVLLPSSSQLTFFTFLGSYLLAVLAGLVSYIPGGLGVFETAMVLLLRPYLPGDQILGSIFLYRIVYYLIPMFVAVVLLASYEVRERRARIERTAKWVKAWLVEIAPRALAVTTFVAGAVLLLSSATPPLPERLAWLRRTLPLPVIELSTLLGSLFGALLLILANALRQRIDAAYYATLGLLGAGAVASLLKGLDWEEASLLLLMGAVLLPCRSFFYRRSSLLTQPLSSGWWVTVAAVTVGSVLALELAYRHVEYSNELWWRFAVDAQASRSLRATLLGGVALVVFGVARLLRPAPPIPELPSSDELDRTQSITNRSGDINGYLALLGDKQLLFHRNGNAFLMFGVSGRTWVTMGDPIGSSQEQRDLAWRFVELSDRHAGRAVFYEVSEASLPIYLELGLALRKLGEEGRVPLGDFSLEGGSRKSLRQSHNRMAREGVTFEVVAASDVAPLLDELEAISNDWLSQKSTSEKGFSLGFFDRAYLARLPVGVVRQSGHIVAFANLWRTESKVELSIDLMRYAHEAPPGVMDYLFTELMLWGKVEGYRYFNLGMAPLSGLEDHHLAPLWNRFGELLFRHGEHFYNFQGLRAFKEKFDPEWKSRYLAVPWGVSVPFALTSIAALVSGGISKTLPSHVERSG